MNTINGLREQIDKLKQRSDSRSMKNTSEIDVIARVMLLHYCSHAWVNFIIIHNKTCC